MANLKQVFDKIVFSKASARIIGKVTDAYFDEYCKKIAYLIVEGESETLLLSPEIAAHGEDAISLKDENDLTSPNNIDLSSLKKDVIGKQVFTLSGISKGEVQDAAFSPNGKVSKLILSDGYISPSAINLVGDVILLKSATPKAQPSTQKPQATAKKHSQKEAPKESAPAEVQTPPAISFGDGEPMLSRGAFEILLDGSKKYETDEDEHTPTRVICDYSFLLGRVLSSNLFTFGGENIGRAGDKVTDEIVAKARRAGKLVELTLSSLNPQTNLPL